MLPIASDCLELITLIMYKQILSERISKSFSGTSFRGTHGTECSLISNRAIVEVLLTLTDNSNYFSECASLSLPNVSWQIIKKTSGLFDTETKYKSVFLAAIKGVPALFRWNIGTGNNVRSRAAWSGEATEWATAMRWEAVEYSEWQVFWMLHEITDSWRGSWHWLKLLE